VNGVKATTMIERAGLVIGSFLLAIASFQATVPSDVGQTPPSESDIESYDGLHRAAHEGDVAMILKLVEEGAGLEVRDNAGRTSLDHAKARGYDKVVEILEAAK
jgi:hypothetical protein